MLQRPFLFLLFCFVFGAGYGQPPVSNVINKGALCNLPNGKVVVQLAGQAPYSVTLSGGPAGVTLPITTSTDSAVFNGLYGGTVFYTLVATDAAGTTATIPILVGNVAPPNIVSATATTPASCLNNDGVVQVSLQSGVGTPNFTLTVNGQTPVTSSGYVLVASGIASGTAAYTVKDANGCLVPGSTLVPLADNLTLTMPPDVTICEGKSTPLTVSSNASGYVWTPSAGLSSVNIASPVASPSTTTTYSLSATLGVCDTTAGSTVTIWPAPVADAGGPLDTTCYGKAIQLHGSGGVSYNWSPFAGLNSANIADPTVLDPTSNVTYSLLVTDANGCQNLSAAKVTVIVRSPYRVFAGNDTSVVLGQSVGLDASDIQNVGFSQYQWSPSFDLNNPDIASPVASFGSVGTYTYVVTATGPNGCQATDSITVRVYSLSDIFVPTAFTPNHDGHNDVLRALPVSIKDFKYLSVFNRWGQLVFTTTNFADGWDGTFNGHEAPAGVYVWMAGGVDYSGKVVERKGTVILVR